MSEIILTTINAKYIHASFGLRYLKANLRELEDRCEIAEFDKLPPNEIAALLIAKSPRLIGIGVYIWNAEASLELASIIKSVRPDIVVVLGGPEISYESESQEIYKFADHVITGEADIEFYNLCSKIISGQAVSEKLIKGSIKELSAVNFPYYLYSDEDINHRVLYVEASRGCPFTCEFCLSSLEIPVRQFEISGFLDQLGRLIQRGAKQFKFVDRTFNLNIKIATQILNFCLENYREGMFFHFEMVPDRLPPAIVEILRSFPAGSLQLEVGIQTFNPEVSANISRRQDYDKISQNLKLLRETTNAHIHADLIVGLPGETLKSFGIGFNKLVLLNPQEIQVGVLKKLKGTPIVRHDEQFAMNYNRRAPYEVLSTKDMDFFDIQRLRNFARYWDLIANSGKLSSMTRTFVKETVSTFDWFLAFSDYCYRATLSRSGLSAGRLAELLVSFASEYQEHLAPLLVQAAAADFTRTKNTELPSFLAPDKKPSSLKSTTIPKRQAAHLKTAPAGEYP